LPGPKIRIEKSHIDQGFRRAASVLESFRAASRTAHALQLGAAYHVPEAARLAAWRRFSRPGRRTPRPSRRLPLAARRQTGRRVAVSF